MRPVKNHELLIVGSICVIGLLLRLGWVLYIDPQAEHDAANYRSLARELAGGAGYGEPGTRSWRPPGYPFLISLTYRIGMSEAWGGRLIDVGASFLLSIVLTGIVFVMAGSRVALWALPFFMLNPVIIGHGAISMSQGAGAVFFYASVLAAFAALRVRRPRNHFILAALGGMSLGFDGLVRTERLGDVLDLDDILFGRTDDHGKCGTGL